MARIRTIKPEFWTSGQVLECSRNARLLFVGLWNFADDAGRHPWKLKQIKAEVFPSDDLTENDILGMLQELSGNGLITKYAVESQDYFTINGWHHQRIDKPQPPKYPPPFQEDSKNGSGTLPPDTKGKDSKDRKKFVPPTQEDAIKFFVDNGYSKSAAIKAFKYYEDGDWHDRNGDPVKNWKQKMRANWFKEEHKATSDFTAGAK